MGERLINPKKCNKINDPFVIQEGLFKNGKISSSYRAVWAEDSFIADGGQKDTLGRNFDFSRLFFLSVLLFFAFFLLFSRVAWLQIVKGQYYYSLAEGNRIRVERVEPRRGIIYDQKLRSLVRNKGNFLLYVVPADLPKKEEEREIITKKMGEILIDPDENKIRELIFGVKRNSFEALRPLFIADNIDYEKAARLYIESIDWPGVVLSSKNSREYLGVGIPVAIDDEKKEAGYLMSLSHVVGYVGKISQTELDSHENNQDKDANDEYLPIDYIGKMGIEYFWEDNLRGRSGKKEIEVDALGKEKKIINQSNPADGNNIVLSLDAEVQAKLEEVLLKNLHALGLGRASAIIMNPQNGEVIALVSLPSYNNNVFARGIKQLEYDQLLNHPDRPLFNRAVSGEFPAGSTIKPVMSAAALEDGIITESTTFLSNGGLRIGQWFFPDWKAGGHGMTNVKKAIAESVNTFYYYIGGGYNSSKALGVERIVFYEKLFGLGAVTGIDLPGEASGFLPTEEWKERVKNEPWYIGDTYHLSIGQGDLTATPLQIAMNTSFFANGGKLYRPHLVKAILDSNDKVLKQVQSEIIHADFIKPENVAIVREGMRQTIVSGSGRRLSALPVAVAGKTGTAQWSSKKDPHAWFTGFAPYDNPEIVITVLIEEGKEGSSVSTTVANDFLKWYYTEYKKVVK